MKIEIKGEIDNQKELIIFKDSLKELCNKYDLYINFCDNWNEELIYPKFDNEEDDDEY